MSKYSVVGDVLMENGITKIYVVTGARGAYSDQSWSTIACFLEEKKAIEFIDKIEKYDELWRIHFDSSTEEEWKEILRGASLEAYQKYSEISTWDREPSYSWYEIDLILGDCV